MKKVHITLYVLLSLVFSAATSKAQQSKQATAVEVIQFHSEHRCVSCVKIEKLTRTTLSNNFPGMPFTLVNLDDKKNVKKAEQFEATGTALFLYNTKTGRKKDLTEFAFMKAGDDQKFEAELKKYIEDFIKS